jgi:hypothetical protein
MNAVYSFFSKPYLLNGGRVHGNTPNRSFFLSWALSVNLAKRYFDKVNLFTDTEGLKILKGLRLPFDNISLELNNISEIIIPEMWASGKIKTYELQTEPFIHLDYDVFLFSEIRQSLLQSGIFAQSRESFKNFPQYPNLIEHLQNWGYETFLPWNIEYAINCGIFGGSDLGFIQEYCKEANSIAEFTSQNKELFKRLKTRNRSLFPIIYEQYCLAAMAEYFKKDVQCLFNNVTEIKALSYCHLMASKNFPKIVDRIEERLKREFPEAYKAWRGHSVFGNLNNRAEDPKIALNFY